MGSPPESFAAADREKRFAPAQVAGVILGVLLLLLLVWFLFLRGEDEPAATTAVPAPATTTEPEEEVDAPSRQDPVETFEVFAPKDPFDPLISAATEGAAGGGESAGEGEVTAGGGDTGVTVEGGTTTITTGEAGGGDGSSSGQSVGGHRVRVIDVFVSDGGSPRAQVQVDGTVYTVDEGERFADNFELVSASGGCATMLFGDDEFTLCEGEEILK